MKNGKLATKGKNGKPTRAELEGFVVGEDDGAKWREVMEMPAELAEQRIKEICRQTMEEAYDQARRRVSEILARSS